MDPFTLNDRIARARGRAAQKVAPWCDLYRPTDTTNPIAAANRILRLPALFVFAETRLNTPVGFGQFAWHGIFDSAYTTPGDYVVDNNGAVPTIWFIAAQQMLLPILCVQAGRILSAARPAPPSTSGLNPYGGVTLQSATPLFTSWPASVLASGGGGEDAGLPADAPPGVWTVLLPPISGVTLRNGDLLTDDLARTAVVSTTELTPLGWRIQAKQAST